MKDFKKGLIYYGISIPATALTMLAINRLYPDVPIKDLPILPFMIDLAALSWGGACVSFLPFSLSFMANASRMDPNKSYKKEDVDKASTLTLGAGFGALASVAGLAGTAVSLFINNDPSIAGLWFASVPMTASIARYAWQKSGDFLGR